MKQEKYKGSNTKGKGKTGQRFLNGKRRIPRQTNIQPKSILKKYKKSRKENITNADIL